MEANESPQQEPYYKFVTRMVGEPDTTPCDTPEQNNFVQDCCEDVLRDTGKWPSELVFWTYVHAAYVHTNGPQF